MCICVYKHTHTYIYTSTRGRSRLDSISPHTGLEMRPQELRGLDFYRLKDGILKESRIVCLTRSVSCSGVCPSLWPAWSSDPGRDTPWSQSSYEVPTVWGCWESGGGRPALKQKDSATISVSKVTHSVFIIYVDLIICIELYIVNF